MPWVFALIGFIVAFLFSAFGAAALASVTALFFPAFLPAAPAVVSASIAIYLGIIASAVLLAGLLSWLPVLRLPVSLGLLGGLFLTPLWLGWIVTAVIAALLLLLLLVWLLLPTGNGYLAAGLAAGPTPVPTAPELDGRGFLIGLNAGLNLFLAIAAYGTLLGTLGGVIGFQAGGPAGLTAGVGIGVVLAVVIGIALFLVNTLALAAPTEGWAKALLGWCAPLMPMAWPVVLLGALFFLLDLALDPIGRLIDLVLGLFGVVPTFSLTVSDLGLLAETGSVWHFGGLTADLNMVNTAYNLGTFTLIDGQWPVANHPATRAHEVGHHLGLAAFGSPFHMIGWLDEFWPFGANPNYAERLAEGNVPMALAPGPPVPLRMWT